MSLVLRPPLLYSLMVMLAVTLAGPGIAAQDESAPGAAPGDAVARPLRAVERFLATYGGEWTVRHPHRSVAPALIYGHSIPRNRLVPGDDVTAATAFLADWEELLGYGVETLVLREVVRARLDIAGTADKSAVIFDQRVGGLEVIGGGVTVVFGPRGELLALDNHGLPGVESLVLSPAFDEGRALALAAGLFGAYDEILGIELAVVPDDRNGQRHVSLSYVVELGLAIESAAPRQERYWIDAGDGSLIRRIDTVYHVDLLGTSHGLATPGTLPDIASNPPIEMVMPGMRMTSAVGDAVTDRNGDFVISYGGSNPEDVTAAATGPWVEVDNAAGSDITLTKRVTPGIPELFLLNGAPAEFETAQLNAFLQVQVFRDFVKSHDPTDATLDFPVLANVNIDNACNAFWNGKSINFFRAKARCPNTAYTTIIAHEEGHWANSLYNGGGITGAFHEGAADAWALYIYDDSEVGREFNGGLSLRTGWNSRPFCGDDVGDECWGEPHAGGEPLMGALWKARHEIDIQIGDAAGDIVAGSLFYWWMRFFDDREILSLIEDHWLILDDDDGYLPNGTPHWEAIDKGFRAHRFPGVDLRPIVIEHEPLFEAQRGGVPIAVTAVIRVEGASLAQALVWYSTDEGKTYVSVPMAPTGQPDEYGAVLPPQPTPSVVYYYLDVTDTSARSRIVPPLAPARDRYIFCVGRVREFVAEDFELKKSNWTHGAYYGTDDWERGEVGYAEVTDARYAYSGRKLFGTDLGVGAADGRYSPSSHGYLKSPPYDMQGWTGLRLQYRRWLALQGGGFDRIPVLVAGTVIDDPVFATDVFDDGWTLQDFDIGALADNQPSVEIEFDLVSDASVEYGGLSIDQVRLLSVEPGIPVPGDCSMPVLYGIGTPGSGGIIPGIGASDYPVLGDGEFKITVDQALGGAVGYLLIGYAPAMQPWLGGFLAVDPASIAIVAPALLGGAPGVPGGGSAALTLPLPPDPAYDDMKVYAQWIIVDAGASGGYSMTRGLDITLCY
ncbi:MAG: hypothetical protein AB1486_06060 [Planctomycetota bacterium]